MVLGVQFQNNIHMHLECDSITENWWQHGKLVWCAVLGGGLEEETATKQLGSVVWDWVQAPAVPCVKVFACRQILFKNTHTGTRSQTMNAHPSSFYPQVLLLWKYGHTVHVSPSSKWPMLICKTECCLTSVQWKIVTQLCHCRCCCS